MVTILLVSAPILGGGFVDRVAHQYPASYHPAAGNDPGFRA
jgi:hypothetical protein